MSYIPGVGGTLSDGDKGDVTVSSAGAVWTVDPDVASGQLGIVNAKDNAYGATGDGSTDDTTALQAAITAAAGGVCWIPPGTYIIDNTLTISANTTVLGAGRATEIKFKTACSHSDAFGLHASSVDGVHIRSLAINGNRAGNPAAALTGIQFATVTNFSIFDVYTTGTTSHGINCNFQCTDGVIRDCNVNDFGLGLTGFGIITIRGAERIRVTGNVVHCLLSNQVGIGIDDWSTSGDSHATVDCVYTGNVIRGGGYGFTLVGSHRNVIANNRIIDPTSAGISVQIGDAGDNLRADLTPIDNLIFGNSITDSSLGAVGVVIVDSTRLTVRGNTFVGCNNYLVASASTGLTYADNKANGCDNIGVYVKKASNLEIRNNWIQDGTESIRVQDELGNVSAAIIEGNRCVNPTTYAIRVRQAFGNTVAGVEIVGNSGVDYSTSSAGTYQMVKVEGTVSQLWVSGNRPIDTASTNGAVHSIAGGLGVAGVILPHGAAPSPLHDGLTWTTTAGEYVRVNGATVGPLS